MLYNRALIAKMSVAGADDRSVPFPTKIEHEKIALVIHGHIANIWFPDWIRSKGKKL